MALLNFEARNGLRCCLLSLAASAAALPITSDAADARYYRHVHYVHVSRIRHHQAEEYSPPYASIVVDGNSGSVLQASNPDAPRHPASLTKVMTLYLLFERLDAGKIKLDTALNVSEHASDQDPTKLDLKRGQTITVEDAIKGVVTKSANDAAVVIAENLGGGEGAFAKLMTQTAHAIGMAHTTYVNASGLPNDDQLTTARDQALLGRAIQDRFPRYYKYFSTESFVFHGEAIRSHNHLLGSVDGVDGIKTGFTRASGFNLLTSVHRDGHFLVAVVMGGHSAFERDARMRDLISEHIKEAALHRTVPMIAESSDQPTQPIAFAKTPMVARADPTRTATVPTTAAAPTAPSVSARVAAATAPTAGTNDMRAIVGSNDPIRPLLVRTVTFRTAPVQSASMTPMPALVAVPQVAAPPPAAVAAPVAVAAPQPAPVQLAVQLPAPQPVQLPIPAEQPRAVVASADPVAAAQVAAPVQAAPQPAKANVATVAAPVAAPFAAPVAAAPVVAAPMAQPVQAEPDTASADAPQAQPVLSAPAATAIGAARLPPGTAPRFGISRWITGKSFRCRAACRWANGRRSVNPIA